MAVHLVTFASRRFRHRQIFLSCSALANGVVDSFANWTPKKLHQSGFHRICPKISLGERANGFYAWKPFIIQKNLDSTSEGDIVFYCDVGRTFPYKLLSGSLKVFLDWMRHNDQTVMPGVQIPWNGPMSMWTKRDAFVAMSMDFPSAHSAVPIQASFSIWVNCSESRSIVGEWMDCCAKRQLISDDSSVLGLPEFPNFKEHRHDQSLLSLICLKRGIRGFDIGHTAPKHEAKYPTEISHFIGGSSLKPRPCGKIIACLAWFFEHTERFARKWIKFN